jgi:sec-independent protein translocase protein TatA
MGEFSIWHWLIVLCVVLLLFGGNKMSSLMGDFAKGIKAFKKNMADDSYHAAPASLEAPATAGTVESAAPREREHVPG